MDKALKRKRLTGYIIFYIIFVPLFIYGSIGLNDLNLDKLLFNPSNGFAYTLACFGMFPRSAVHFFFYLTLMAVYRPFDEALDVAQSIFGIFGYLRSNRIIYKILSVLYKALYVAFVYGAYMGANDAINFITYNACDANLQDMLVNAGAPKAIAVIVWTAVRVCLMVLCYLALKRLCKKHARELELMAVAGIVLYYSFDIINILKDHFHRIRFREMVAYSNGIVGDDGAVHSLHSVKFTKDMVAKTDFHWFTKWYAVGKDGGVVWHDPHSFPSGHTGAAAYSFLLLPLFTRSKALSKYSAPACVVGIGYTMAVALSRMMRGAHYLTDVTGAGIIMFTLMLIIVFVLGRLQARSDRRLGNIKK